MNAKDKCKELENKIYKSLSPLIDNDYVLWDLPYHANIGDQLIWEGEEQFLKSFKYKCLNRCSIYSFTHPQISKDTIILLHGGGNWGDLYEGFQLFRNQIIKDFPDNKIIIFPQTVFYFNHEKAKRDALICQKHNNIFICARDLKSYRFLIDNNFGTDRNILLVPDMAFCINPKSLSCYSDISTKKSLLIQRIDIENTDKQHESIITEDTYIYDWPSFINPDFVIKRFEWVRWKFGQKSKLVNLYAKYIYHTHLIKIGVKFISDYGTIYTTRLHGAILSILLGKEVHILDNNYGKNSTFFNTWLKNTNNIIFEECC